MKAPQAVRTVATGLAVLIVFIGILTGFYFLTSLFYRVIGYSPPPLVAQIINTLLSVAVVIIFGLSISFYNGSRPGARRRWMGLFEPVIVAMERIAKGDFQVRVSPPIGGNLLMDALTDSVNQMALELNQIEHMRQEFISNVSHEIQSPLTSIRGFAQALHDEQLSTTDRDHYLSIIEIESGRLSRMADNMLRLASLEAEHVSTEPKPYRLDKQIRALILAAEPQWAGKALDVDAALGEVVITGDEDLLGQVWSNLLNNSIKFTPVSGRISVEMRQHGDHITCRFTDTGIGISEADQARVFERFYKADRARERSREGSGSGLGLAIARKIVELHHGAIAVASQPGAGTTFMVTLPVG
ncbi:MAG TPA: HAMP domain-containing sensor histidine kinase [Ktedonobacterales bacterium]|nr:HAMP domain-containing sensor histidine kinase [Ktedonobacterales bacterium]